MNNGFSKEFKNIDEKTLEAAKRGDTKAVLQGLNESDRKKIEEALSDKEKLKKILSSDAAQNLIKKLGGNKNG